jgi:hypothetical protein
MPPISPNFDNDFIDEKIKVGSIVSIDIDGISHPKWNIVLDFTDDKCLVASVFINTNIYFKNLNNKELEALQYTVDTEKYSFLDHNSVIDCSKVFTEPYAKFKDALIKNAVRKKGDLPEGEIEKITELLRKSKEITGKTKKKFKRLFNKN